MVGWATYHLYFSLKVYRHCYFFILVRQTSCDLLSSIGVTAQTADTHHKREAVVCSGTFGHIIAINQSSDWSQSWHCTQNLDRTESFKPIGLSIKSDGIRRFHPHFANSTELYAHGSLYCYVWHVLISDDSEDSTILAGWAKRPL